MPPKKSFGQKLKGVGRRIVQEAKKVPGTVYREGIKPELERIRDKFTEVGPDPGRRIKQEPQAGTTTAPFEEGPKGFRGGTTEQRERAIKGNLPAKILPQVSRPVPPIAEQIAPVSRPAAKDYGRAGGRTSSYKVGTGKNSAVARLAEADAKRKARETRPLLRRGTQQEKAIRDATKTTTAKPLVDQTSTAGPKKGRTKAKARGKIGGYTIKATAAVPKAEAEPLIAAKKETKKETRTDRTAPARKQRAGLKESRKGKGGKRKFSATKTYAEIGKAASASQKPLEINRLDTTAEEVARMMTEQDVGREAERAEAALKQGRKPQREKARYRFRTRGLKRSEGRGR